MNTKQLYFYMLMFFVGISFSSLLNASQCTTAKTVTQQQDQKPSQEELKLFFEAAKIPRLHNKVFELIQKYGANIVNASTPGSDPVLITATSLYGWSYEEFERLLQVPGVNIDISSSDFTPLTAAMFFNAGVVERDPDPDQLRKIELLIKYEADINHQGSYGFTPLMDAARDNQPQVVSMLLRAGASTDGMIKNGFYEGKTFDSILKERHPELLRDPDIQEALTAYNMRKQQQEKLLFQETPLPNVLLDIVHGYVGAGAPPADIPGVPPTEEEKSIVAAQS